MTHGNYFLLSAEGYGGRSGHVAEQVAHWHPQLWADVHGIQNPIAKAPVIPIPILTVIDGDQQSNTPPLEFNLPISGRKGIIEPGIGW